MKRLIAPAMALLIITLIIAGCANMPGHGWTTLIDGDKGMENKGRRERHCCAGGEPEER